MQKHKLTQKDTNTNTEKHKHKHTNTEKHKHTNTQKHKTTTTQKHIYFARCCLGMSRAERPSVSKVKVKLTAWVNGHHITKELQMYNKRINKNMQQQCEEEQQLHCQLGVDRPEGEPCGKEVWPKENANSQVEAMTGAALHLVA